MTTTAPQDPLPRHVAQIRPPHGALAIDWGELWDYRELLWFFAKRDIVVRYKQSLLGIGWAVLGPLGYTVVFTILFGTLGKLPTDGLSPAVFYMAGNVMWRYFATALSMSSNSLVGQQALLTKIYVPRLLVPMATVCTPLIDFIVACGALLVVMLYSSTAPAATALFTPLLVLVAMLAALGAGLFFSALNVRYRDVRQLVPFISQFWMYATIIVPFSRLPERWGEWRYLWGLNPLAGVVEGFRWCLAHHKMPPDQGFPWALLSVGVVSACGMVLFGLWAFKRMEHQFADVV